MMSASSSAGVVGGGVDETLLRYDASPTLTRFHHSSSYFRGIMGPIGSGKSVGCCWEIFMKGLNQQPYKGVRKTRWIVVRNTYKQLLNTTKYTWDEWFGHLCVSRESPTLRSTLTMPHPDGESNVVIELLFVSMDRPDDVDNVFSLETTGAWMNEAALLDKSVITSLTRPVGRYPSMRRGGPTWRGIIADTNPPTENHWWYQFAEKEKPEDYAFFRQPGAMYRDEDGKYRPNPEAENVEHLKGGYQYYRVQLPGKTDAWIHIYVLGEYGREWTGEPVYKEFNESEHVIEDLSLFRGMPVYLGWDFGLSPACVAAQYVHGGQLRVLREYCSQGRMGVLQLAEQVVKPGLALDFPGCNFVGVGDPSGVSGSQADKDLNCFTMLDSLGLPARPAKSNEFVLRREAVDNFLARRGGFFIDKSCVRLINGFTGGYKYDRVQVSGEEDRYHTVPQKNEFSHPHDALQYIALGVSPVFTTAQRQIVVPPRPRVIWG